ncbi:hypothetical protein M9H77_06933 [Catharanthus roseus]|uniref:Uncharacterized protein n=1 Tax=Catharanthus roseus TaxID=4058 RepID=A0ACC0BTI1_CATRO|nr:hypothetical protein M9H77_06933 [Catharanthus roseus]
MCARGFNFLLLGGHMLPDISGSLIPIRDQLDFMTFDQDLSSPQDDYIRWYRDITRVYIGNPARCDTWTYGYQPAAIDRRMMTSMLQEVDDMTTGVLEGPPSSPTRHPIQLLRRHPQESVPSMVKRGVHKLPNVRARRERAPAPPYSGGRRRGDPKHGGERGGGSGGRGHAYHGSYVSHDPFDSPRRDALTFSLGLIQVALSHLSGAGTSYVPPDKFDSPDTSYVQPPPSVRGMPYAPPCPSTVGLSFDAPLPPGTAGSSIPYMPIFRVSSFDSEEHGDEPTDDVTPAQQLGFRHRIGKKTTRFTLSDWC